MPAANSSNAASSAAKFKVNITNQKPAELNPALANLVPLIDPTLASSDFIATQFTDFIQPRYVDPLYISHTSGQTVDITDVTDPAAPQPVTADALVSEIRDNFYGDSIDAEADDELVQLYTKSMRYSLPNRYPFNRQLAIEALAKRKSPLPTSTIIYSAAVDVIPAAKNLLTDFTDTDYRAEFVNGMLGMLLAHQTAEQTLFIAVKNNTVYDRLVAKLAAYPVQLAQTQPNTALPADTAQKITDAQALKPSSDITSWLLGDFDPSVLSFSRIIQYVLAELTDDEAMVLPLNLRQAYCPTAVSFVNVDSVAHSTQKTFNQDLKDLLSATAAMRSFRLTSVARLSSAAGVARSAQHTSRFTNDRTNAMGVMRAVTRKFHGKPLSQRKQLALISKLVNAQISKRKSDNTFKSAKSTFMRPNRRHPDDLNLKGVVRQTSYRPDIHIYLDTSGSISEAQYKSGVTMLIQLAKRLNTNLYFTSFSHVIAQPVKLNTKNQSVSRIYQEISRVPKVTGGTDFTNVWTLIDKMDQFNNLHGNAYQLNFVITDFEWQADQGFAPKLKAASVTKTYYLPTKTSDTHYQGLLYTAGNFARSLEICGNRNIRNHMLL